MFQKGHTINLGRKNPNAGRKRTLKRQVLDFLKDDEDNLPAYLAKLSNLALHCADERVQLQALTYLSDRHLGKARQTIDQRVAIGLITADGIAERIKLRRAEETNLIAQYSVEVPQLNKAKLVAKDAVQRGIGAEGGINAIQGQGEEDTATEREETEAPTE